jgi:hypothetical protein
MPCLNVAEVSRMNRASSMPRNRRVLRMVGKVASPTPMMPMSGDSSSVIVSRAVLGQPQGLGQIGGRQPPGRAAAHDEDASPALHAT